MNHLKANGLKDYCNFFLHFGLVTAAAAGSFIALGCPPVLGVLAAGLSAGVHLKLAPWLKKTLQKAIDREKIVSERDDGFPNVFMHRKGKEIEIGIEPAPKTALRKKAEIWVKGFSERLGLNRTPQITMMKANNLADEIEAEVSSNFGRKLLKEFNKRSNAFAFSHDKDNVVLTNPIVETLDEGQLKGVVAHEVAHIAAEHTKSRTWVGMVGLASKALTQLNVLFTAVTSVKNAFLYIGANYMTNIASRVYARMNDMDKEKPDHIQKIATFRRYFFYGSLATLGVVAGAPELLLAQGIHFANLHATELVEKRLSRCNEFQADRVAAELTKQPEDLGDALKTLRRENLKMEAGFNFDRAKKGEDKTWLSSTFERVRDLTRTHPNVDRRVARLSEMQMVPA